MSESLALIQSTPRRPWRGFTGKHPAPHEKTPLILGLFTLTAPLIHAGTNLESTWALGEAGSMTGGTVALDNVGTLNPFNNTLNISVGTAPPSGVAAADLAYGAIPEPSTYGLLGAGALASVAMVRRRKDTAK